MLRPLMMNIYILPSLLHHILTTSSNAACRTRELWTKQPRDTCNNHRVRRLPKTYSRQSKMPRR